MTLTTTRPSTQPMAKAGPFERAFGVPSMRMTAMIGTGLSATPIANGSRSPIASPIVYDHCYLHGEPSTARRDHRLSDVCVSTLRSVTDVR